MNTFYVQGGFFIFVVCLFVLFLVFFKKKSNLILGLVQRGVIGFLAIVGLDKLFAYFAIELFVGVNAWTLLTSAILGIPGVCMLFCINFF